MTNSSFAAHLVFFPLTEYRAPTTWQRAQKYNASMTGMRA